MTRRRRLVSAASLLVGVLVLGVMAVVGYRQLTAPFGSSSDEPAETSGSACPAGQHQVVNRLLHRKDVKVSVYNAGTVKGAAGRTMKALERAGFRAGDVGNAPDGVQVARAKVYTTDDDRESALLVAWFLGRGTQIVQADQEYGPGVDVFIGNKLGAFHPRAKRSVKRADPVTSCAKDRKKTKK